MHAQSLSCVWLFATSWTIAHQAPLSVEFSREECWSGLPFPSSGGLVSCVSYTGRWFFTTESPGKTLEIVAYLATWCEELTHWKRLWYWEGLGAGGEGMTEDEMVGWHHRLDGREFEWTPGVGDGQGGLACCSSWGCKESDMAERLNWLNWMKLCSCRIYFLA